MLKYYILKEIFDIKIKQMITIIPEAVSNKTVCKTYLILCYKFHAKFSLFI